MQKELRQIEVTPATYYEKGDSFKSPEIYVTGDLKNTRFRSVVISIVPEGRAARKEQDGPLVPGPWPSTITLPIVITGGASARDRLMNVEVGEEFTVDQLPGVWRFRSPDRTKGEGDGPQLERVDEEVAA